MMDEVDAVASSLVVRGVPGRFDTAADGGGGPRVVSRTLAEAARLCPVEVCRHPWGRHEQPGGCAAYVGPPAARVRCGCGGRPGLASIVPPVEAEVFDLGEQAQAAVA